ncbi:MAG: HEAT repeat domain-containing protein [Myxococcales bacterium]|nr:HEAT repeat domain-containing protein [Myxococcales bacterium]
MRTHRPTFGAVVSVMALIFVAAPAAAQGKGKTKTETKGAKGKTKVDTDKVKAELESGDAARITAALEQLIKGGEAAAAAAPAVEALLKKGLSSELMLKALDAAGAMKQTSSSSAIAPYVKHRVPGVRHAAAKALIKSKGPEAIKALRAALRSSDAQVRGIAATGLGALGAKDAMTDLFSALAHSVPEAAAAIGQLCEPSDCDKFANLTGKHQFDIMSSGFDQILFRAEKDVAEDQKIKVIGRLRELGTKEASKYLADVKGRWPEGWSKRVKQAIEAAVKATGGGGGEE